MFRNFLTLVKWMIGVDRKRTKTFGGKLYFTTLNYASNYTLHHKLFERTLCTLNYHTLHLGVTFIIIFNGILLHMTSTCILLRWNKLKRLKHPCSKSIKTKANFFPHSPPCLMCVSTSSPNSDLVNPKSLPNWGW